MNLLTLPPYLSKGDTVAIVSPSGKIDNSLLIGARNRFESWGLKVSIGKHANGSFGKYAGTIEQRLEDLQAAMDDERVKAILCSRGGYGVVHLLDELDFTRFELHPKWLIGFSDITALHNAIQKHGFASLHAPMAQHLTVEDANDTCSKHLRNLLLGNIPTYSCKPHELNNLGRSSGFLRGGNLAVFSGLRSTPYDIPAKGTILFVEDISERPHAVERMFYNLKMSGVLDSLSGLIIGQFTEYEEDYSLGKGLYAALADVLKGCDYPICFNFPVGHVTNNLPLICGAKVGLVVGKESVELSFLC